MRFFYREGVLNANQLTAPASDEFDLVRGWQSLHDEHGVALHICVAAALRRGVTDEREAQQLALPRPQFAAGFYLERARRASGSGAYLRSDGAVLMKRVAFVLSSAPHGSAAGREGLDALLATSALTDDIGVFLWATACFSCYPNSGLALCWPATTSLPLNCCRYMISTSAGCAPTQRESAAWIPRPRGWWMSNARRRMPCAPVCMNLM